MSAFGHVASSLVFVAMVANPAQGAAVRLMPCVSGSGDHVRLVGDEGKGWNLYRFSRGRWVDVTRFARPHHIFDHGVSPDGRYLFAWHMDFSPRRVSIYDLQRGGRRIGRFEPGFGGSFCWNFRNHIVHLFGCGSDCIGCKVYDRQGRVLFELVGRPMKVSPTGRYLAALPNTGAPEVAIYDLHATGDRSGLIATTPIWNVGWVGGVDAIDWRDERSVTFDYALWNDESWTNKRTVTLDLQSSADER